MQGMRQNGMFYSSKNTSSLSAAFSHTNISLGATESRNGQIVCVFPRMGRGLLWQHTQHACCQIFIIRQNAHMFQTEHCKKTDTDSLQEETRGTSFHY